MQIIIDGWDAGIKFSACHFIPGHDKCSRLHGHIYAIHAKIFGNQNEPDICRVVGAADGALNSGRIYFTTRNVGTSSTKMMIK